MARLDLYLKNSGLFHQRSAARRACDAGQIWVDGQLAKASREVRVGEVLRLCTPETELEAEVLAIPEHPVAKKDRQCYCRITRIENRAPDRQAFGFDEDPRF